MKIIASVFVLLCIVGTISVCAEDFNAIEETELLELGITENLNFIDSHMVTRENCIIAIMRTIGITDEYVQNINGADYIAFADTSPYSYFGCAMEAKIAYGEECTVNYPTLRTSHTLKNTDLFFFPQRAVTVKECLAFMNRCLESNLTEFDLTIETAMKNNLVKSDDEFIQNPDAPVSKSDFFLLIGRLLHQKRYKYYSQEEGNFKMKGNVDEIRSATYLEMLRS